MTAASPRYEPAGPIRNGARADGRTLEDLAVAEDHEGWVSRTRVFLTPIAAPSIMGLFGFFIATLMVGAWQAGWYGPASATGIIWPFALFAGGLMQVIAAIASFRARDGVALAVHAVWGAFWLGWSILQWLVAVHVAAPITIGAYNPAFAFWFIALTCVTGLCMLAAAGQNLLVALTLAFLSCGTALTAAGFYAGSGIVVNAGGWLFICSAVAALLAAGAMMFEHAYGRTIIPLGTWSRRANLPGAQPTDPIAYPSGMPGVKVGQ
jgi:succinate-acetate transporter protein